MISSDRAFSGFSVDDIEAAKTFYGSVLGVKVTESNGMLRLHLDSGGEVLIYPKPDHRPATYTMLNFVVSDIDAAVADLTAQGVSMLRYDTMPSDANGIHRGNGPDIAWFNDPAGNVIGVIQG
jgi:predicted enzyme related to lactoylglutathione lyase